MDIGGVVSAFFSSAGPGGFMVLLVIGGACAIYYTLARWIVTADQESGAAQPIDPAKSVDA